MGRLKERIGAGGTRRRTADVLRLEESFRKQNRRWFKLKGKIRIPQLILIAIRNYSAYDAETMHVSQILELNRIFLKMR